MLDSTATAWSLLIARDGAVRGKCELDALHLRARRLSLLLTQAHAERDRLREQVAALQAQLDASAADARAARSLRTPAVGQAHSRPSLLRRAARLARRRMSDAVSSRRSDVGLP